jgi:hypothetical protein
VPCGPERLLRLWGTASDNLYAVGSQGTILHRDESGWQAMDSPTSEELMDVWGLGPDPMFAVGYNGTILRWDGVSAVVNGPDVPEGRLTATPNPANPGTLLDYSLSHAGPARVEVYDARGRLVRTLIDKYHEAGDHQVMWRGRDQAGRPVSSGVYYARIELGGTTQTCTMTLVR